MLPGAWPSTSSLDLSELHDEQARPVRPVTPPARPPVVTQPITPTAVVGTRRTIVQDVSSDFSQGVHPQEAYRLSTCSSTTGTFYSGVSGDWPSEEEHSPLRRPASLQISVSDSSSVNGPRSTSSSGYPTSSDEEDADATVVPPPKTLHISSSSEDVDTTPLAKVNGRVHRRPLWESRVSASMSDIGPFDAARKDRYGSLVYPHTSSYSMRSASDVPNVLVPGLPLELHQPSGLDAWTLSLDQAFNAANLDLQSSLASPSLAPSFDTSQPSVESETSCSSTSSLYETQNAAETAPLAQEDLLYYPPDDVQSIHEATIQEKHTKKTLKVLQKTKTLYGKFKRLLAHKQAPEPVAPISPREAATSSPPLPEASRGFMSEEYDRPSPSFQFRGHSIDMAGRTSRLSSNSKGTQKASIVQRLRTSSRASAAPAMQAMPSPYFAAPAIHPYVQPPEFQSSPDIPIRRGNNRRFSLPAAFTSRSAQPVR